MLAEGLCHQALTQPDVLSFAICLWPWVMQAVFLELGEGRQWLGSLLSRALWLRWLWAKPPPCRVSGELEVREQRKKEGKREEGTGALSPAPFCFSSPFPKRRWKMREESEEKVGE